MKLVHTVALPFAALALVAWRAPAPPASGAANTPVFGFESLLDAYFDETGLLSLQDFDVIFAPEGPVKAEAAIVDEEGNVVARHACFEEARFRAGVFAKAQVQGPADVTLTRPGLYGLVLLWDGQPATRLPFVLQVESAGDDPFDPVQTYRFDGLWRRLGHVTTGAWKDQPIPVLNFWLGGIDLPAGKARELFVARLHRDGEQVAHSRLTTGSFAAGHFQRVDVHLYHPHERVDEPTAKYWTLADMTDGEYELKIARQSDDALLRNFRLTVAGGELLPHPRSAPDYEPRIDYLAPRVTKKGSSAYEFVPTVWVESR